MTTQTEAPRVTDRGRWVSPAIALLGSALAVAIVAVMGLGLFASDGAAVADLLAQESGRWQTASLLAVFAASALLLAAIRLGQHIGGTSGTVATVAGSAVALLLGAYYGSFGGGAVVAAHVLDEVSGGLGEATLVLANMVELTRYAPSLVLLMVAVVARRSLPKALTITAGVLIVVLLFPITTWIAVIATPVWLGIAGAVARPR